MKALLAVLILITSGSAFAYEDLFAQQEQRDEAIQQNERATRIASENQHLLAGIRAQTRRLAPVDPATAKCSSGWTDDDYQSAMSQLCDGEGCFTLYGRPSESFDGFLFTCHFNLTDGSQCFLQGYSLPHIGMSGRCVDTKLRDHALDINMEGGGGHASRPVKKKRK